MKRKTIVWAILFAALSSLAVPLSHSAEPDAHIIRHTIITKALNGDVIESHLLRGRLAMIDKGIAPADQSMLLDKMKIELQKKRDAMLSGDHEALYGGSPLENLLEQVPGIKKYEAALNAVAETVFMAGVEKLSGETKGSINPLTVIKTFYDLGKTIADLPHAAEDKQFVDGHKELWKSYQYNAVRRATKLAEQFEELCASTQPEVRRACDDHAAAHFNFSTNDTAADLATKFPEINASVVGAENFAQLKEISQKLDAGIAITPEQISLILDSISSETQKSAANVLEAIGSIDQFMKNKDTEFSNSLNSIEQGVSKNRALIADVAYYLQHKEEIDRQNAENAAEEEQKQQIDLLKNHETKAKTRLALMLLNRIDPKLAERAETLVNAQIAMTKVLQQFNNAKKLGVVTSAALTLNVVNIGMTVFAAFSGANEGPSTETQYLMALQEQIGQLREQIAALGQHMDQRFDYVDTNIANMYSAMLDGLSRLERQNSELQSIVTTILDNSLDIQTLIIAENQRTIELIGKGFYSPCVNWFETSNVAITNDRFVECSIRLQGQVIEDIWDQQLTTDPLSLNSSSLAAQLMAAEDREIASKMLYRIFSSETGYQSRSNAMVSPARLLETLEMYKKFLFDWPTQAHTLLKTTKMDIIEEKMQEVSAFSTAVLNSMSGEGRLQAGSPIARVSTFGTQLKQSVSDIVHAPTPHSYVSFEPAEIDKVIAQDPTPDPLALYKNPGDDNSIDIPYPQSVYQQLVTQLPGVVRLAARMSVIRLVLSTQFTGDSNMECPRPVLVECVWRDNFRITLGFAKIGTADGSAIPLVTKNFYIIRRPADYSADDYNTYMRRLDLLSMDYRIRLGYKPMNNLSQWDWYWTTSDAEKNRWSTEIETSVRDHSQTTLDTAAIDAAANEWELIVKDYAEKIKGRLKAISYLDQIKWTNVYVAGLVRMAFAENIYESDELAAIASGNLALPDVAFLADAIDRNPRFAWKISHVVSSEVDALVNFLYSPVMETLANNAKQWRFDDYTVLARNTDVAIRLMGRQLSSDPELTPNPAPQPPDRGDNGNESGGGKKGGGGSASWWLLTVMVAGLSARYRLLRLAMVK